jgi:hypothetical protein
VIIYDVARLFQREVLQHVAPYGDMRDLGLGIMSAAFLERPRLIGHGV